MPKLFPIYIEVEELAVGKVMRLLNKMPGVAKFNLDMDRPAKPNGMREPKQRRAPKKFDMKAEDFIGDILFKNGATPASVLKQHFADVGRSPNSVNSQLSDMQEKKLIKQDGLGGWVLTKLARDRLRNRAHYKKKGGK